MGYHSSGATRSFSVDISTKFDQAAARQTASNTGYIEASLDFLVEDTRSGLTAKAKAAFSVIKQHAETHPDDPRSAAYVAKISGSEMKSPLRPATPGKP